MPYMPTGRWPEGDTTYGRIAQVVIVVAAIVLIYVFWRKVRDIFRD